MGGNQIEDDGIGMILKELHLNNTLTELRIAACGLSVQGRAYCTAISLT